MFPAERLSSGVPAPPQSASTSAANTLITPRASVVHLAEQLFLCVYILIVACVSLAGSSIALPSRTPRLTSRQLQAVLLARDGLKHPEIALALGISSRQVHRLLSQARQRVGAASTAQLVAMLVTDELAAHPRGDQPATPNLQQ